MSTNRQALAHLNTALERLQLEMEAPEVHGTLTGLICAAGDLDERSCVNRLRPTVESGDILANEARQLLEKLCAETRHQLKEEEFNFRLLLPDDEAPVEERIGSLGVWVQGFLMGLSLGGVTDLTRLPGDSGEAVRDLTEIAAIENYELAGGEEDEESYAELVEYVRTSVFIAHEELHPKPPASTTLH